MSRRCQAAGVCATVAIALSGCGGASDTASLDMAWDFSSSADWALSTNAPPPASASASISGGVMTLTAEQVAEDQPCGAANARVMITDSTYRSGGYDKVIWTINLLQVDPGYDYPLAALRYNGRRVLVDLWATPSAKRYEVAIGKAGDVVVKVEGVTRSDGWVVQTDTGANAVDLTATACAPGADSATVRIDSISATSS